MSKVLFILPTLSAGGAENYALRFIKHYLNDFEFHVLSVNENKGDLHEEFKKLDITLFYQSIGYFDPRKAHTFYKLLKKHNYNSVVSFTGNFSGLPLTLAKYAGVKNRIVFHRRSTNAFGKNPIKLFYNKVSNLLLRKNATKILSNSETAFQNFYKDVYKNSPKYKVIKNGVDVNEFDIKLSKEEARKIIGVSKNTFIIGHVGRYDPAKNHETIFKVIKSLESSCDNLKFVFCGRGTDSEAFQAEVKKHQIENKIITLGMRRDLPIVYKMFDLFYFPSITEGQPNALIEAMVSGLPVVTSNIPPILEALPPEASTLALTPLDIISASKLLQEFYNMNIDLELYKHKKWAKEQYDARNQFFEFKSVLTNKI